MRGAVVDVGVVDAAVRLDVVAFVVLPTVEGIADVAVWLGVVGGGDDAPVLLGWLPLRPHPQKLQVL